jgi:hypothetical protein
MRIFTDIILIFLCSCKDESTNSEKRSNINIKTEKSKYVLKNSNGDVYIAVIPAKQGLGTFPSTLSMLEVNKINEMLPRIAGKMYKEECERRKRFKENPMPDSFNLMDYKRQYCPYINKTGEKEVFINCFCRVPDETWKTKIVTVDGGGSCYFMGVINLVTDEDKYFMFNAPM